MRSNCARREFSRNNPSQGRRQGSTNRKILSSFHKIVAVPAVEALWVLIQLKSGKVPALIDTGAQVSCIRADVVEFLRLIREPCAFGECSMRCILADGTRCEVKRTVKLHIKLLGFSWNFELKVLEGGAFPLILGLDFMKGTKMVVDVAAMQFSFGFAPQRSGKFGSPRGEKGENPYLRRLIAQISEVARKQTAVGNGFGLESIMSEFPGLFSSGLGTARCVPYEIELLDAMPVRSPHSGVPRPRRKCLGKWLMNFWNRASCAPANHLMPVRPFWSPNGTGDLEWWWITERQMQR